MDWRVAWYSVLVWFLAIVLAGFVILPWFYLAFPVVIFAISMVFFRKINNSKKRPRKTNEGLFLVGLWISVIWFLVVAFLDFVQFIGFSKSNAKIYFDDFRNWFKFPLIILIPVIYSLILENMGKRILFHKYYKKLSSSLSKF